MNRRPVIVRVGLYVADIVAVGEATETFEIEGYLYTSWHDEGLIGDPRCKSGGHHRLSPKEVWSPELDFDNSQNFKSAGIFLFCQPDGTVVREERFDDVLTNDYFLDRFPFDSQTLVVTVQPFVSPSTLDEELIAFDHQSYMTSIAPDAFVSPWRTQDIRYQTRSVLVGVPAMTLQRAIFSIDIKRSSGFYVWKIFLPILLMVLIPWSVFFVNVTQFDWQMKIPMSTMLAMVAFYFAIERDLPKLSYLTFFDVLFLTSFTFIFMAMVEVTVVHVLVENGSRQTASRIHRVARWLYPVFYLLVILIFVPVFFAGPVRAH